LKASTLVHVAAWLLVLSSIAAAHAANEERWARRLGLARNAPMVALPAAAGPIVGISERVAASALTQTIGLRGDPATIGQNAIIVTVSRGGFSPAPTQEELLAEMSQRLPGIAMSFGSALVRNSFGIFGYALGRSGPQTCLYAWQAVSNADEWITGESPGLFGERHGLSIRVRLCRTAVGAAALLAAVQGLQTVAGGAASIMAPVPGSDALAAAGGAPSAVPMIEAVQPEPRAPAAAPRRKKRLPPRPEAAPPADDHPALGFPTVPMPR
jgi:hypothetical protein